MTGENVLHQTEGFLEQLMADPEHLELVQLRRIAVTVDEPRVQKLLVAIEEQMHGRIEAAIRLGIDQGVVQRDLDPDYVAFCWLGFMQAACFRETLEPGSFRSSAVHIATWLRSLEIEGPAVATVDAPLKLGADVA
jgi:hypothetical protein